MAKSGPHIIVLGDEKGGSGKSTTAMHLIVALLAAVEATAAEKNLPVHIEGYPPPHDPRVDVIKVTPDPGVIEVNVQPASSWREAVDITRGLYEDAHHSRLGTDKFMIDGLPPIPIGLF